jgi:hypothetical protein
MQINQDFISTFWLTSHGKMPVEWHINRYCQNRHQRQVPDLYPCVDFVPIKAWRFPHPGCKNIFAIIYSRNTASAELKMPS